MVKFQLISWFLKYYFFPYFYYLQGFWKRLFTKKLYFDGVDSYFDIRMRSLLVPKEKNHFRVHFGLIDYDNKWLIDQIVECLPRKEFKQV
jgi:hypothetical protein